MGDGDNSRDEFVEILGEFGATVRQWAVDATRELDEILARRPASPPGGSVWDRARAAYREQWEPGRVSLHTGDPTPDTPAGDVEFVTFAPDDGEPLQFEGWSWWDASGRRDETPVRVLASDVAVSCGRLLAGVGRRLYRLARRGD